MFDVQYLKEKYGWEFDTPFKQFNSIRGKLMAAEHRWWCGVSDNMKFHEEFKLLMEQLNILGKMIYHGIKEM